MPHYSYLGYIGAVPEQISTKRWEIDKYSVTTHYMKNIAIFNNSQL